MSFLADLSQICDDPEVKQTFDARVVETAENDEDKPHFCMAHAGTTDVQTVCVRTGLDLLAATLTTLLSAKDPNCKSVQPKSKDDDSHVDEFGFLKLRFLDMADGSIEMSTQERDNAAAIEQMNAALHNFADTLIKNNKEAEEGTTGHGSKLAGESMKKELLDEDAKVFTRPKLLASLLGQDAFCAEDEVISEDKNDGDCIEEEGDQKPPPTKKPKVNP